MAKPPKSIKDGATRPIGVTRPISASGSRISINIAENTPQRVSEARVNLNASDRIQAVDAVKPKKPAPPLALFPMKLEYRFHKANTEVTSVNADAIHANIQAQEAKLSRHRVTDRIKNSENLTAMQKMAADPKKVKFEKKKITSEQLLLRWYPQEGFADEGLAPLTDEEARDLATLKRRLAGQPWWKQEDPEISAAWQSFVENVGAYRAIYLIRASERGVSEKDLKSSRDYQSHIGRIVCLPTKVTLFACINGKLEFLQEGAQIPRNKAREASKISYTPEALDPGGWLVDFKTACDNGMGLIIKDSKTIQKARDAEWIIAIGVHSSDAVAEVSKFAKHHIANGQLAFLPQDTPTNNTADSLSYYTDPESHIPEFTQIATIKERRDFDASKSTGADLLAKAMGLDPELLREAVDSNETGYEDAKAMLRVIGPALLDGSLDGVTFIDGVSENEFIDVLAASMVARGVLPSMRFGEDAMGVLPVTKVFDLQFPDQKVESSEHKVHRFMRLYSTIGRTISSSVFAGKNHIVEPGDPKAAEKLNEILTVNRVSKRIDVYDQKKNDGETSPLGCPYVTGPQNTHKPAQYLKDLQTEPVSRLVIPRASNRVWPLLYRLARISIEQNISKFSNLIDTQIIQQTGAIRSESLRDQATGARRGDSRSAETTGTEATRSEAIRSEAKSTKMREALEGFNKELKAQSVATFTMDRVRVAGTAVKPEVAAPFQRRNNSFAKALIHLENIAKSAEGTAKLEMLLIEVIDLFQHRLDAFATGLAYSQLIKQRDRGEAGLRAGYYGFIGKLRPEADTGFGDGYIHAPSIPQAQTSALMRSAYTRNRVKGAFAINLNSKRIRNAVKFLDLLDKGHSVGEVLGLRGERWLHDEKLDGYIMLLRAAFPLKGEANEGLAGRRIFDGLAFLEESNLPDLLTLGKRKQIPKKMRARIKSLSSSGRKTLQANLKAQMGRLKASLNADLDALSDLVMAEATHQRAMGRADIANAWLEVLSGQPPPGVPTFVKTHRKGQGSSHKLTYLFDEIAANPSMSVREIIEPALAQFARTQMPNFSNAQLEMSFDSLADDNSVVSMNVKLVDDLNMTPYDLVVGGASELQIRTRHFLAGNFQSFLMGQIGTPNNLTSMDVSFVMDTSSGNPSLDSLLERAKSIRRIIQNARAMGVADLNQAAPAKEGLLDETEQIASISHSVTHLFARLGNLSTRINSELDNFTRAKISFDSAVGEYLRRIDINASDVDIEAAHSLLLSSISGITSAIKPLASYGEPTALRPYIASVILSDPEKYLEFTDGLKRRLEKKKEVIDETLGLNTSQVFSTQSEAQTLLNRIITTFEIVSDGDATMVLPPLRRNVAKLRPSLNALGNARRTELNNWAEFRKSLKLSVSLQSSWPQSVLRGVRSDATLDLDDDDLDPRSESIAPLSHHFGVFVGQETLLDTNKNLCGLVCDEWTEQRPSEEVVTGVAVNYSTSQAEAPYCVLLCVPPSDKIKSWTPKRGADMVKEAIEWMKLRALSSHERSLPQALFDGANAIEYKNKTLKHIPTETKFQLVSDIYTEGLSIHQVDKGVAMNNLGIRAGQLFERTGFSKVKD